MVLRIALFFLLLVPSLRAHNGATAVAQSVNGIRTDGDLSDWPVDASAYRLLNEIGKRPESPEDLSARLHVGYEGQLLNLALYVRDDLLMATDSARVMLWQSHRSEQRLSTVLGADHVGWHQLPPENWFGAVRCADGACLYE